MQGTRKSCSLFSRLKRQSLHSQSQTPNTMPCGALVKMPSMQPFLGRKLLIIAAPSLPFLHTKAKNLWNIHIAFTQIWKFGTSFSTIYSVPYLTLTLPIHNNSVHLIKWVTENNHPVNIINDRELQNLLTVGQPSIELPSNRTISCNIDASYLLWRQIQRGNKRNLIQTLRWISYIFYGLSIWFVVFNLRLCKSPVGIKDTVGFISHHG